MLSKLIAFLKPTENWSCRYWTLYDPERLDRTFHSQQEAHDFAESQKSAGYITLIQHDAPSTNATVISELVQIISTIFSLPLKELTTLIEQHFSSARHHK